MPDCLTLTTLALNPSFRTEEVRCEGSVMNMGKTLAFTKVDLFSHASGKLLATGQNLLEHE